MIYALRPTRSAFFAEKSIFFGKVRAKATINDEAKLENSNIVFEGQTWTPEAKEAHHVTISDKASVELAPIAEGKEYEGIFKTALAGNPNVTDAECNTVEIAANGTVTTKYTVEKAPESEIENGTVTVSDETAAAGAEVTVTATPAADYELDEIIVTKVGGGKVDVNEKGEFTMPAEKVTVSATFKAKEYEITKDEAKNGTFTVAGDKTVGATQTITASPSEGYEVDNVTVKDKDNKAVTVTDKKDGTYTFAMPSGGAKVTVTFKATKSDDNTKSGDTKPGATDGDNNGGNGNDNKDTGIALAVAPVVLAGACAVVLAKKKK